MKKILSFAIVLVSMLAFASCSSVRNFSQVGEIDGVSRTYLSQPMLRLAGKVGDLAGGHLGVDVSSISDQVTSIEIVSASTTSAANKVRPLLKKEIKSLKATPFFATNGNGKYEGMQMYATPGTSSNTVSDFVMVTDDGLGRLNVVIIRGNIDISSLDSLLK